MRFFNPLAVAFAVDTVISVDRIFLSGRRAAVGARGTGGDAETLRHLGDREELDLIVAMTATAGMAENSRFRIAVDGAPSSRPHLAGLDLC